MASWWSYGGTSGSQLKPGASLPPEGMVGTDHQADTWVCHKCRRTLFSAWPADDLPRSFQCPDCKEWNRFNLNDSILIYSGASD
jgi:hypothetical protein